MSQKINRMNSVNGDYPFLEGQRGHRIRPRETQIGVVAQTRENNEDVGIGGFGCWLGFAILNVRYHQ